LTHALVTIVMPTRNQIDFLPESVECVLSQSYSNLELVVADGASTDGTQQWLADRAKEDDRLRWFTEVDTGPAQALNRALRQARGTIVGWLNSDDLYTEGAVQRGVQALESHSNWQMVYGHAQHIDRVGTVLGSYPTLPPDIPLKAWGYGCFICQPTVFFKRTLNLLLGPLDESLRASFDFDYWLRVFKCMPDRIGFIQDVQAQSRLHDACITQMQRRTVALEGLKILKKHLGMAPTHWALTYVDEMMQNCRPTNQEEQRELVFSINTFVDECTEYIDLSDLNELKGAVSNAFGNAGLASN
jgi:glycosyltransferase involved in cell wall biosynthesis